MILPRRSASSGEHRLVSRRIIIAFIVRKAKVQIPTNSAQASHEEGRCRNVASFAHLFDALFSHFNAE